MGQQVPLAARRARQDRRGGPGSVRAFQVGITEIMQQDFREQEETGQREARGVLGAPGETLWAEDFTALMEPSRFMAAAFHKSSFLGAKAQAEVMEEAERRGPTAVMPTTRTCMA